MKAIKIATRYLSHILGGVLLLGFVACTPPGPAALLDGEALLNEEEYAAAIAKLREATDLLPDSAEAWNFLGLAYHRAGKPGEAVKAYKNALRLNVDLLPARYNLGCLFLENGEFKDAENQFKTYEILVNDDPKVRVKIGLAQLEDNRPAEAERSFKAALSRSRAFPEAWNGLGKIYLKRRLVTKAYDHFHTAITEDASFSPAILNQGVVAHQFIKDYSLALQKYRRFMFLDPQSPRIPALKRITALLEEAMRPKPLVVEKPEPKPNPVVEDDTSEEKKGEPEEEISLATSEKLPDSEAVEQVPVLPADESTNTKQVQVEVKAGEVAGKDLVDALRKPQLPDVTKDELIQAELARARAALEEQTTKVPPVETPIVEPKIEPPVQEISFEKVEIPQPEYNFAVADERPENVSTQDMNNGGWRTVSTQRSGLGISIDRQMFRNAGSGSESTSNQRRAGNVQRVPGVPYQYRNPLVPAFGDRRQANPFFQKGNQAFRSGRESEAILAYREAISRDPAFFEAHFNMGLAAIRSGFAETALEAYEMALVIDPGNRNARFNFALALEQGRHHNEAASELEALLGSHPDDVNAHFTLATLYAKKIGNAALARNHYQRVLALDPNYSKAVSIRYWLSASD